MLNIKIIKLNRIYITVLSNCISIYNMAIELVTRVTLDMVVIR